MSYSSVTQHGAMLFDQHRNELFKRAIEQTVRPGAVVLDLGAGLGMHGLLAAKAGAARVFLVDPQPVVQLAAHVANASGVQAQIVCLQGRIEDLELPEQVDVITSVMAGNLLFSEDLLPALFHARDRYLKSGGVLIPDRAQLWLAPLCAPILHKQRIGRWSSPVLGFDYSRARQFAANEIFPVQRGELTGSTRLSPGAVVADLDLMQARSADCNGTARCAVEQDAECHGLLAWIRLRVGSEWLSTDPESPEVHWSPVVLPVDPPIPLAGGESVEMSVQRPAHGDWTWSIAARAGSRRHSTFLARMEGGRELARIALPNRVALGERGERAARALVLLTQGCAMAEVVADLGRTWPLPESALADEVQALAWRYGRA
jgi:SAM-dependent methyltransferase